MTENIKISTVKLSEKIKGFCDTADLKRPEIGDFYISSTDGKLKLWRHDNTGKAIKVVLRPKIILKRDDFPIGMLLMTTPLNHFINFREFVKPCGTQLSDRWQANHWRNCPFKKNTVIVEVRKFNGTSLLGMRYPQGEASKFSWEDIAQFRVVKLCEGVEYEH